MHVLSQHHPSRDWSRPFISTGQASPSGHHIKHPFLSRQVLFGPLPWRLMTHHLTRVHSDYCWLLIMMKWCAPWWWGDVRPYSTPSNYLLCIPLTRFSKPLNEKIYSGMLSVMRESRGKIHVLTDASSHSLVGNSAGKCVIWNGFISFKCVLSHLKSIDEFEDFSRELGLISTWRAGDFVKSPLAVV